MRCAPADFAQPVTSADLTAELLLQVAVVELKETAAQVRAGIVQLHRAIRDAMHGTIF